MERVLFVFIRGLRGNVGARRRRLLFLFAAENTDFLDLFFVGDDLSTDSFPTDVAKHLMFQTAFDRFGIFSLLGPPYYLDVLGCWEGDFVTRLFRFFALAFQLEEGNFVAFHLGDDRLEFLGKDNADGEDQDQRSRNDFPQHNLYPLQENTSRNSPIQYRDHLQNTRRAKRGQRIKPLSCVSVSLGYPDFRWTKIVYCVEESIGHGRIVVSM